MLAGSKALNLPFIALHNKYCKTPLSFVIHFVHAYDCVMLYFSAVATKKPDLIEPGFFVITTFELELRKAQQIIFCSRIRLRFDVLITCCTLLISHSYLLSTYLNVEVVVSFFKVFDYLRNGRLKYLSFGGSTFYMSNVFQRTIDIRLTNVCNTVRHVLVVWLDTHNGK